MPDRKSAEDLTAERRKRLDSKAEAPNEVARRGIDLAAVVCADLGHAWLQTEIERQRDGALKGLPARICVCRTCDTQRTDVLTWNGTVAARYYSYPDSYLDNLRALDDDQHARRSEYRRLMLAPLQEAPAKRKAS